MVRHCVDCDRLRIDLIVEKADVEIFSKSLFGDDKSISHFLSGVRFVEYKNLPLHKYYPEATKGGAATTQGNSTNVTREFKKMYGCLAAHKGMCIFMDAEATIIRTTRFADIISDYRNSRLVVHNRDAKPKAQGMQSTIVVIFRTVYADLFQLLRLPVRW